jgi:hypothetical protein
MSKRIPWATQDTKSDSQQEDVVDDMKEQARLLNLEADISEAGTDMLKGEGVSQEVTDMLSEKVPGKKEVAKELKFVADILERTRNS